MKARKVRLGETSHVISSFWGSHRGEVEDSVLLGHDACSLRPTV